MPQVQIGNGRLSIRFDCFNLESYRLFLKCKKLPEYSVEFDREASAYTVAAPARFAPLLGVPVPATHGEGLPLSDFLFDDQQSIVRLALEAKRYACWSDCGLGKTGIGLEFARQVNARSGGGRVLIVTLNEIVPQWIAEAKKFYGDSLPVMRLESRAQMIEWCAGKLVGAPAVAVTNYEKFNHKTDAEQVVSEIKLLAGIIADESSRLKTGGGKQKWSLIKSCRGVEYKLSLTATPAPNELMEFASQASWLEKMRAGNSVADAAQQIIWTYFTRDSKTHRWTVKQHAQQAFFEWMSSWSIYVRDPRKYGWRKNMEVPPDPEYFHYEIPITPQQRQFIYDVNADPKHTTQATAGMMFVGELNAIGALKLSQAAKGFVYEKDGSRKRARPVASNKPQFVIDLIAGEASDGTGRGLQTLVWTVFDEEARILADALSVASFSVETLTGETKEKDRLAILDRFRRGETRVLIGRANMLGYGLNFQFCGSMIFSGWSFSYESFYQAVRRAYRFGQTRRLRVHVPLIPELEGQMWEAIGRKQRQHEEAIGAMEENYIKAMERTRLLAGEERAA